MPYSYRRTARPIYVSFCIGAVAGLILNKLMPTHHIWNWQWWVAIVPTIAVVEVGYWLVLRILGEKE